MRKQIQKRPSPKTRVLDKIQKILANEGVASRREIERWIEKGRIMVNKQLAQLGQRIDPKKDKVAIDGKPVRFTKNNITKTRVIIYHKPEGEICTRNDPEGRKTIYDQLPKIHHGRWISIGRLDINSSGLLLLTNDGELANQLMHPSNQIEREYAVRVIGEVDNAIISRLKQGVKLDDGFAKFNRIKFSGGSGLNQWYHVVITEGRNREVRRLWASQNITVSRLIRIRFGNVFLPRNLRRGAFEELSADVVKQLRKKD